MRTASQAEIDREVTDVAKALQRRGSVAESVALLRAAVSRDGGQVSSKELLDRAVAGEDLGGPSTTVELGYGLVDAWIRRGMLVEALALLSGTSLGSRDKGKEWANLLGELLAPVPVDAEDALRAMYRQLMTGGASVALTLLEERDRKEPAMAAWAKRRLELLRWMLLDNAEVLDAEAGDALAPSELAGSVGVLVRRGLGAGHAALREFVAQHPTSRDALRALEAVDVLVANLEEEAARFGGGNKTMPMVGHTAAMMQLRMGNLREALGLYDRMIRDRDDDRARVLAAEVEVLLRVLDGQPAADDVDLESEVTQMRDDMFVDEATLEELPAATKEVRLPDWPAEVPEGSGMIPVTAVGVPEGDGGATMQQPTADEHAEALVVQGRVQEAEQIYRGLLDVWPDRVDWARRADELRQLRTERSDAGGVLVRVILPVK
ncbi:MAG: hypothetical protein R3B82_19305 [Sandaracinaceae bacterium]